MSDDDGQDGQDGTDQIPPPSPDGLFNDEEVKFIFDVLKELWDRIAVLAARGENPYWYVTAYPNLQYLVSDFRLIDPADPNSTAELFVDAGPDAYGEVDYKLHPQYIASVSRIRIQIEGRVDGDNPRLELDLQHWDGTVFKHVTLANGVPVAGKPGWVRLTIDAVRPVPLLPFGPDYDTFVVRFRDVEMDNLIVRGIVPRADVNASGAVEAGDVIQVIDSVGLPSPEPTDGDVNGDTTIDSLDLNEVIQGFGGESGGG